MANRTYEAPAFAPEHKHDRTLTAGVVAAIWAAMVVGFGLDLFRRAQAGPVTFPLIVHLHAAVYTSWLVLLAVQAGLVRTGNVALHRRLGLAAVVLVPLMLVLGPATVISQIANNPYMPDKWIAWMSVQFTNAFGSAVLIVAALLKRGDPPAHKRLMLMGTIALTEPGFGRIWEAALSARWGDDFLPLFVATYIGTLVLVVAVGVYDYATRGRPHPAYVASALWIFANELLADWLFHQPFWLAAMKHMTGHPV